jgi:hypothetical protein
MVFFLLYVCRAPTSHLSSLKSDGTHPLNVSLFVKYCCPPLSLRPSCLSWSKGFPRPLSVLLPRREVCSLLNPYNVQLSGFISRPLLPLWNMFHCVDLRRFLVRQFRRRPRSRLGFLASRPSYFSWPPSKQQL